ncbi:hypothetical protein NFJ02_23g51760 [Pycnococcus provasolii]
MKVVAELKEQVSDMRQAQKTGTYLPPISTRGVDFLAKRPRMGMSRRAPSTLGMWLLREVSILGHEQGCGWTLWQEYMLHDSAVHRSTSGSEEWAGPSEAQAQVATDPVENWTSFRHAQGHVDADLFNLWCDNVYRHVYDIWIDATTGTGEGIYARNSRSGAQSSDVENAYVTHGDPQAHCALLDA